MDKSSAAYTTPLRKEVERLANVQPTKHPLLSLYLNLASDQHGRDNYDTFVRKAFAERLGAFEPRSPARDSFTRDADRIRAYLSENIDRSANALAIFACAADNFFEALQLDAPLDQHWLFVGSVPHLYPLARLIDQYPRYAAVVLDTHKARIFVFGLAAVERTEHVTNEKTRRTAMGGWSQARYQRHADNFHLHHVKEVVDTLDRIVTAEHISHIVVAGDEVAVPILKAQLPTHLREKVVDVIRLDRAAGASEVLEATLGPLREKEAMTDAENVERLITAWRSGGLGVAGPEATLDALERGQVEELIIAGTPALLKPVQRPVGVGAAGSVQVATSAPGGVDERRLELSSELVTRAEQTGARIRFVENADLLANIGGVGALLRFRI
jgi:peptide chain release factor subunit 1